MQHGQVVKVKAGIPAEQLAHERLAVELLGQLGQPVCIVDIVFGQAEQAGHQQLGNSTAPPCVLAGHLECLDNNCIRLTWYFQHTDWF